MKTSENLTALGPIMFDDDQYPCWYADLKRSGRKKDYKWKVGCKHRGQIDEYSFKISKAGDITDDNFWQMSTGVDFAIKLIDLFRNGGQKAIKSWVKNGCA